MLAKFETKNKKIGDNVFYVCPFPPFQALELLGDIQAVVTTAMKDSISAVDKESESVLDAKINIGVIIAGFGKNLTGNVLVKFANRMIDAEYVSVMQKGEDEAVKLTEALANNLFSAKLTDMLKLLYFIIEVNYSDFFALIPDLSGLLGKSEKK